MKEYAISHKSILYLFSNFLFITNAQLNCIWLFENITVLLEDLFGCVDCLPVRYQGEGRERTTYI